MRERLVPSLIITVLMLSSGCREPGATDASSRPEPGFPPGTSGSAGPGSRIAFMSNRADPREFKIWVIGADGSGAHGLIGAAGSDSAPAWSPDGARIAFARSLLPASRIFVVNADGSGEHALTGGFLDADPTWSPDGTRLAFQRRTTGNDPGAVYLINADGSEARPLTTGPDDANPSWSPGGDAVAFQRKDNGASRIYVVNTDGSNLRAVTADGADSVDAAWSPGGDRIAFTRSTPGGYSQIRVLDVPRSTEETLTTGRDEVDGAPAWSPDGRSIAFYRQRRNDVGEVWVMNSDGSAPRNLTLNPAIDSLPAWASVPP